MPKSSLNISLKGADDIFSTEESRQEEKREQVQQIPIAELFPFKNHPFKVLDDETMQRTVESMPLWRVLSTSIRGHSSMIWKTARTFRFPMQTTLPWRTAAASAANIST